MNGLLVMAMTLEGKMVGRHKGWPVVFASFGEVLAIKEKAGLKCFVWPDEGEFVNGKFVFNHQHQDFEPLMIDVQTANLLVKTYKVIAPHNQARMRRLTAKCRGNFGMIVDVCWKHSNYSVA